MPTARTSSTDAHRETADAVAAAMGTDVLLGLTSREAALRRAQEGANTLIETPPRPLWREVASHFRDPLILLLLGAIVISLAAWRIEGGTGWPVDALVIAAVVVLNAIIGVVETRQAQGAVAALARLTAVTSTVMRDGRLHRVPSAELVRGDLLILGEGDEIGADARLVIANVLRVAEASLTGESESVHKDAAPLLGPVALGDRLNMVFKGTTVSQGTGSAVITATGMDTEMGAIAALLEKTVETATPLQREIERIGRNLGVVVVVIALIVVGTILAISGVGDANQVAAALLLGVAIAVAAVPEGLPAILSVVLAVGVQRLARHKAIVKKLSSVETLGSANVICVDKTGTLTRAEMTIERIVTASGETRVTGIGYAPMGRVEQDGAPLVGSPIRDENVIVLSGGSLAGNAQLREASAGDWQIQGDPTEAAFLVAERKLGVTDERMQRFERIGDAPFTSERKRMSTLAIDHAQADRLVLVVKGAPDVLLARCTHMRKGGATVAFDAASRGRVTETVDELADAALRTLAVAYRLIGPDESRASIEALEHDLVFAGMVGIIDPPRPEAAVAIREAHRAGIRVVMITGDHPRTAARIARDLGMIAGDARVLGGMAIDAMPDGAFVEATRTVDVYARVTPAHKLRIVDALQARGDIVAMTGDGVNDAPALRAADIGIAMGITGTEVTRQASRMILADDNFATIIRAVREGRAIVDNIRKCLRYLLASNMGEVLTVFLGIVGAGVIGLEAPGEAVVLPLLATQILWINLVTDSGPAIALGVDPAIDDVMARRPRGAAEHLVDGPMWAWVLSMGLVVAVSTLLTIDLHLPGGLIEGTHDFDTARTAGFTTLVLASMFACLAARSETASATRRLFSNRWLWIAIGVSVLMQVGVVHLSPLNAAFQTVPLTLEQWTICAIAGSAILWASELRKWILRQRQRQRRDESRPGVKP